MGRRNFRVQLYEAFLSKHGIFTAVENDKVVVESVSDFTAVALMSSVMPKISKKISICHCSLIFSFKPFQFILEHFLVLYGYARGVGRIIEHLAYVLDYDAIMNEASAVDIQFIERFYGNKAGLTVRIGVYLENVKLFQIKEGIYRSSFHTAYS